LKEDREAFERGRYLDVTRPLGSRIDSVRKVVVVWLNRALFSFPTSRSMSVRTYLIVRKIDKSFLGSSSSDRFDQQSGASNIVLIVNRESRLIGRENGVLGSIQALKFSQESYRLGKWTLLTAS
jgi:hypothetical protein